MNDREVSNVSSSEWVSAEDNNVSDLVSNLYQSYY
jgi:hypothetical protein